QEPASNKKVGFLLSVRKLGEKTRLPGAIVVVEYRSSTFTVAVARRRRPSRLPPVAAYCSRLVATRRLAARRQAPSRR
ncbi:hypothetical protein U1Q18_022219, partial [Sarracenia purpurea var. burkii]